MKILEPAEHRSVQPLLAGTERDLAIPAVVAGNASGRIYAAARAPEWALISPHWGRLYIVGRGSSQAAAELRELFDGVLCPAARRAGAEVFTLAYPPDWDSFIAGVLAGKRAVPAERQYYRWSGTAFPPAPLAPGFSLVPADLAVLQSSRIANLHLLTEEMASERSSVDDFLARSFGVVALHGGELAGWCLSEYNDGSRCEVGIATLELFQRQGLATAMGRQFLAAGRARGVNEIGWHCWKRNVPSAAAALKIGLDYVADYPVYFGWFNGEPATG